jgi:two-component system, NtrC family, sensor kinase
MSVHAREPVVKAVSSDLNEVVRIHSNLAYQGFRAADRSFNLELVEEYDGGFKHIQVANHALSRVILNLVANACHALRERQRRAGPGYRPTLRLSTRLVGDVGEIHVEDNGVGIPVELRRRIFDPFFTTKPPGEGTGLGLSMCYEIVVKQLGGNITIKSVEGEQTKFTVTLPIGPAARLTTSNESEAMQVVSMGDDQ